MKFTSRGFKAAAAVVATASLLGAGLLPAQAAPKTITVWADETRGPQLKSLIDGNTDIAPGYTIKVKFFSGLTALQSAWDKATAAGGPDVITGPASFNSAAKSGKVLPLLYSKAAQAEIPSGAKQALSYNGRTYGVPLDVDTTAMYWNTAFGAKAPATIDAMFKLYQTQKAAGKVTGGICAFDGTWGAHPILTALGGGAYGFTNNSPDANKVLINSATFKANVKKYLVGSDGKSTGFLKWDGCADEFKAGKMLAANTGAWNLSGITAAGIKFTLGAVPGLTASTKGAQWVNYSGAWVTSYARTHGVELGAKKLVVDWMASSAGQLAMYGVSSRPPANTKAAANVSRANTRAFSQAASTGIPQFSAWLDDKTGGSNWYDTLGSTLTNILVKGDAVDATLDKAAVILKKNFANASK
jgi:arabinogalactan oligomer/maltooligosaccharide transport system substrate-binding protein